MRTEVYCHFVHLIVLFISQVSTRLYQILLEKVCQARQTVTRNNANVFIQIIIAAFRNNLRHPPSKRNQHYSPSLTSKPIIIFLQELMQIVQEETCRLEINSFNSLIYEDQTLEAGEIAKQDFLRAGIYNQYSQDEKTLNLFCEYLTAYAHKIKGAAIDELDLNIFTIDELRQVIDSFKLNLSAIRVEKEKFNQQQKPKVVSSIILDEQPRRKTFYNNLAWDYELIMPTLQCNREKHFFDSHSSGISIKFVNYFFKKSKGFFGIGGKLMLWIEIETSYVGKKIKVARNIDDFSFLERTLISIFPHSYIPPLRISEDDKNSIDCMTQASIRKMVSQCFSFLCKVSKQEEFLENVYTFRFLVEEKPNNYRQHKANNDNLCVDGLGNFKNIKGKVSVNISDGAEKAKKEFMTKSVHFQKIWRNISNIMTFASKSSNQLSEYLNDLTSQLKLMTKQLQLPTCKQFVPLSKLISVFESIANAYGQTLKQSDAVFRHLRSEFVDKAQVNWQLFYDYQNRISAASIKYQQRRKEFLEGEAMKLIEPVLAKDKIGKVDLKVQFLNLEKNPLEEEWQTTETPWYGYLNHEFMATFTDFVRQDQQRLQKELLKMPHDLHQRIEEGRKEIEISLNSVGGD